MNKNRRFTPLADKYIVFLLVIISALTQCTSQNKNITENTAENIEYKQELSTTLFKIKNEDSLLTILEQFYEEKNDVGKMVCYRNLGSQQRASSRFSEAISSHRKGLEIAIELNDTIEIVQALNNLGTNFRRIGAYNEGFLHHYQALHYLEVWSGLDTPIGNENHIKSLNGIGNNNLMTGNYKEAKIYFSKALKYENKDEKSREQRIVNTNIGSIFLIQQQYDSAYFYYQKSLEQSIIIKSDIGVGVNLLYLDNLYEQEQKYELAKNKYHEAFELMDSISNKWYWLQACISVARIHLITGKYAEFKNHLQLAEKSANEIKSPQHLSAIYKLKHDYDSLRGNDKLALQNYKKHRALEDSLQNIQEANRYMEMRLMNERNKVDRQIQEIEAASIIEQQERVHSIYIAWLITILSFIILVALYLAYRQRTRSNIILKTLESTRSDFFTNITHELRTPLTVIQGLNRQIEEKKNITEKEKAAFRRAIDRQSNNLLNLVNQLLDLAKLKGGVDDPQWKRGNIIAYLEMTAESFCLYAGEKGVNLMFYSHIDAIEMDFIPLYIDKIASNLLSNAIKHTDAGGKIDFVIIEGDKPDSITIRISDTGEGISQDDIKHIFDLFYQSPQAKNISGTGIGLAFTEMMVGKMKGKIGVESEVNKGSVFTINLPLNNKKMTHIPPLNKDEKPITTYSEKLIKNIETGNKPIVLEKGSANMKALILIVEDNSDIVLYLRSLLIDSYEVISAWNGEQGMIAAEKHIPDLVITDLMMPVKDGYQFANEMKQNRLLDHIPIIVLTAKTTDEDRIEGLRHGVDAYIKKPFQHEELLLCVENIFENRRLLKEKYVNAITRGGSERKLHNDAIMKFLQNVSSIINAEIDNPELDSAFLADKMAMSTSQLSRKINGVTGFSTISYVLQLKLNKAKKMLADENISIAEVSDACGFYYASYFSRVFKKEFGLTPSQYQKNMQFKINIS